MTLTTGKKKERRSVPQQRGLSLIEVMLCVVVLSVGLAAVNQTLLKSLESLIYVQNRFEADRVASNQIWEIQNQAWHHQAPPPMRSDGSWLGNKQSYAYQIQAAPAHGLKSLYEVRVFASGMVPGKEKGLTRVFYARLPQITKT